MHRYPTCWASSSLALIFTVGLACTAAPSPLAGAGAEDARAAHEDTGRGENAFDAAPVAVDAGRALPEAVGRYTHACDGSGAVALDDAHFLNFNDENQVLRLYARGASAPAVQELDISAALGLDSSDEADFEDAARVGSRIFALGSHGRKKSGTLDTARHKFFALDISGVAPAISVQVAGVSSRLLSDMLVAANWVTPNSAVIEQLTRSSRLADNKVASLAPKQDGTNIEGLAALPGGRLAIGFRNPRPKSTAVVVTLLNPDALILGSAAQFGEAIELGLGGEGIRGMAWSPEQNAVLVLSGPRDTETGPFALWKWSGQRSDAAVKVRDIAAPAGAGPEAIVVYPGMTGAQVLFDGSSAPVGASDCASASTAQKSFSDAILRLE